VLENTRREESMPDRSFERSVGGLLKRLVSPKS
jgi:hypothetical protein